MKKISILIPCYNEEENVVPLSDEVVKIFETELTSYDYEIIFADNCSTDNTRVLLRKICEKNRRIKAIFNVKNFGVTNSVRHAHRQVTGDCLIGMCADFQDPPELIPAFVREWENGYKVVMAIKVKSKENPFMRLLRSCYYKIIKKVSDVEQTEHLTGFGLVDRVFVDVINNLSDPLIYNRGVISELGFKRKDIPFEQPKRKAGKSSNNLYTLYDLAMLGFTSYTKIGLRIASISGFIMGFLSFLVGLGYFIYKLLHWDRFDIGIAPLVIGMFLLGSVQLFFIGFIGEYVMAINTRLRLRDYPLVIEEERINFD